MADIKGIIVPIVTPMNEDESINLPKSIISEWI